MPEVGSCHVVTAKQQAAFSASNRSVPCSSRHTSQTIASFRLRGKVDWKNTEALWSKVARKCYPAMRAALGTDAKTRAMTSYDILWFGPTAAERRQGAKWLRCDLVLRGTKRLLPLPTDDTPLVPVPVPDSVAMCQTDRWITVCASPHTYRAVGAVRLKGKFPGSAKLERIAVRRCPDLVSTRKWRYDAPSSQAWRHGDKVLVCLAKTRR
nr:septum formation family protein [Nocardioides lijunqiniae]